MGDNDKSKASEAILTEDKINKILSVLNECYKKINKGKALDPTSPEEDKKFVKEIIAMSERIQVAAARNPPGLIETVGQSSKYYPLAQSFLKMAESDETLKNLDMEDIDLYGVQAFQINNLKLSPNPVFDEAVAAKMQFHQLPKAEVEASKAKNKALTIGMFSKMRRMSQKVGESETAGQIVGSTGAALETVCEVFPHVAGGAAMGSAKAIAGHPSLMGVALIMDVAIAINLKIEEKKVAKELVDLKIIRDSGFLS